MDLDKFLEQEGPRAINPDMHPELIKDIATCPSLRPWKEEAVRGFRVRQNLALLRQRLVGQATRRLEWVRKAGMRVVARVDEDFFWQHRLKYGPGCWHDKEFRDDTLKRHPEMAVPETKRSTTVQVPASFRDWLDDPRAKEIGERPTSNVQRSTSNAGLSTTDSQQLTLSRLEQIARKRRENAEQTLILQP